MKISFDFLESYFVQITEFVHVPKNALLLTGLLLAETLIVLFARPLPIGVDSYHYLNYIYGLENSIPSKPVLVESFFGFFWVCGSWNAKRATEPKRCVGCSKSGFVVKRKTDSKRLGFGALDYFFLEGNQNTSLGIRMNI